MTAFVLIFLLVPETKQRTLEELDQVFNLSTIKHANYQLTTFLPWFVKRWILLDKKAELEPLYKFDDKNAEKNQVQIDHVVEDLCNNAGVGHTDIPVEQMNEKDSNDTLQPQRSLSSEKDISVPKMDVPKNG